MGAAADGHATVRSIHHVLAPLNQLAQVTEARGAVCVGEHRILAAYMAEAVRDAAAFAPVLFERNDAENIVQVVLAGKLEGDVNGAVSAAVVD